MTEEELEFLTDTDTLLNRVRDYFDEIDEWLVLGGSKEQAWDNGWKAGRTEGLIEGRRALFLDLVQQRMTLTESERSLIPLLEEEDIRTLLKMIDLLENGKDLRKQIETLVSQRILNSHSEKSDPEKKESRGDYLKDTGMAIACMRTQFDKIDEQRRLEKEREAGFHDGWEAGQRALIKFILNQRMVLTERDESALAMLDEEELTRLFGVLMQIEDKNEQRKQVKELLKKKIRS